MLCAQAKSGRCKHRFDVPGQYFFTSGFVAEKGDFKLAFGGKIVVLEKEDLGVNVEVLVSGIIFFQIKLLIFFR